MSRLSPEREQKIRKLFLGDEDTALVGCLMNMADEALKADDEAAK